MAEISICNIIIHKYSFRSFVTDLHESIQLDQDVLRLQKADVGGLFGDSFPGTFYQQYDSHPRDVPKHAPLRRSSSLRTHRNAQINALQTRDYTEARQCARLEKLCFKCSAPWFPRHVCAEGAINEADCDKLPKGASNVHVVTDLLLGLEGEAQSSQADNTDRVEGAPHDTNIWYIAEPMDALDDALSAAHTNTGDTEDLAEAMDRR